jgi:hypothetical protein
MIVGIQPVAGGGPALVDQTWLNGVANGQNQSFVNGLVAHAGGTKAAALQIPAGVAIAIFATVATTGDSALLPQAKQRNTLKVYNAGAQTIDLYGRGTDTVNQVATATAYTLTAGQAAEFFCGVDGNWSAIKSA